MKIKKLAVAGLLSVAALSAAACSSSPSITPATVASPSSTSTAIQKLAIPPTAGQIASEIHATGFTDCGSAPLGGVVDAGMAKLDGKRIGIDTFANASVRDSWEATAAKLGVVPFEQAATWVVYTAVSQTGTGCE
jgi:hypothetical protein